MQFLVIMVTDPQTNTNTNRQDRLEYMVPLSLACSVMVWYGILGFNVPLDTV